MSLQHASHFEGLDGLTAERPSKPVHRLAPGGAARPCAGAHGPAGGCRPVLNIGRMAPGGEGYYLASVADGVEEYYLGAGELPGRWAGAGAQALGLSGRVEPDQLRAVLGGTDPSSEEPLLGQRQRSVPGFDLTFRAPKSVSLLYGLGDPDVSATVRQAHDAATDAALGYLEREALWTRRGRGGAARVPTDGAVAAAFMHRTSRAGDPLLHTHVLVANLGHTSDDGRWRTLDSRRIYAHAKTAGYLYQAALRHELCRRLDVAFEPPVNGTADLAGIDRQVIEAFSQRRAQILDLMAERGESSAKAAQVATLDTRTTKAELPDQAGLRHRWRQQATELGLDPDRLLDQLTRAARRARTVAPDHGQVAERLVGPDGLTARSSTFTRRDVLQAWCDHLPAGAPVGDVERLADALLEPTSGAVVALDEADSSVRSLTSCDVIRTREGRRTVPAVPGHARYSTPDLLALEQHQVDQAAARRDTGCAQADRADVDAALQARPTISDEQADMVRQLATGGDGVSVVVGKAGAGKTYALDAARQAWQASGVRVVGTALAARAAVELEDGAGIDSYTLDRLLADIDHPQHGGLPTGSVVVVDEAGMVGTRKLAHLLDKAQHAGAKVVLVGDPAQLPEIDAGGLYRGLAHRLPAIELADNRRQQQAWERDALDQLRDGTPADAVTAYGEHGRIVVDDTADAVREQLVGDWWHARTQAGLHGVIVAARRADVADLNHRAHTRMAAAGELTGPPLEVDGIEIRAGDRVLCRRNDRRAGVVNGTRGTVTHVDTDSRTVTLAPDRGDRPVELPSAYLDAGHLVHGYAVTAHKAQGMTTEATWVLGSDLLYREWGYVALSRGRQTNRLYLVGDHEPDPAGHDAALEAPADPVRQVAVDLHRSRGKHLALDHTTTDQALTGLSDTDLHHRHQQLRECVLEAARDQRAPATDRLQVRRDDLVEQRARLADRLDHAREQLHGCRRRHRRHHRAQVDKAEAALNACDQQLAHLDHQLTAEPLTPDQTDPGEIAEFLATEHELDRRSHQRTRAAEFAPPTYVLASLGARPDTPSARDRWRTAVAAIERYRTTWGIDDPHQALGDPPDDLTRRSHHDQITRLVVDTRQQLLDPPEAGRDELHADLPALAHG